MNTDKFAVKPTENERKFLEGYSKLVKETGIELWWVDGGGLCLENLEEGEECGYSINKNGELQNIDDIERKFNEKIIPKDDFYEIYTQMPRSVIEGVRGDDYDIEEKSYGFIITRKQ